MPCAKLSFSPPTFVEISLRLLNYVSIALTCIFSLSNSLGDLLLVALGCLGGEYLTHSALLAIPFFLTPICSWQTPGSPLLTVRLVVVSEGLTLFFWFTYRGKPCGKSLELDLTNFNKSHRTSAVWKSVRFIPMFQSKWTLTIGNSRAKPSGVVPAQ